MIPLQKNLWHWIWLAPLVLGLADTGLLLCSFASGTPLAERSGFDDALGFLSTELPARTTVLVYPPDDFSALHKLPRKLWASDALPQPPPSALVTLSRMNAPLPGELKTYSLRNTRVFNDVQLSWYTQDPAEPRRDKYLFNLQRQLPEVQVYLEDPSGKRLHCNEPQGSSGWHCPDRPQWNRVSSGTATVNGQPYPGVWAHPVAGHSLLIDMGKREIGEQLHLELALDDNVVAPGLSDIRATLVFSAQGNTLQRTLTRNNRRGIATLNISSKDLSVLGPRPLIVLRIECTNDARRHLYINLTFSPKKTPPVQDARATP